MSMQKVPLDVVAEFVLGFLTQKEIVHMIHVFRQLGARHATWKAYFMGYSSFFKATGRDFFQKSVDLQRVRRNWALRRYRTAEANLEETDLFYRSKVRIDPHTQQTAVMNSRGNLSIFSDRENKLVQEFTNHHKPFQNLAYRNGIAMMDLQNCIYLWRAPGPALATLITAEDLHECAFSDNATSIFSTQLHYICQTSVLTGQTVFRERCLRAEPYARSSVSVFPNDHVLTAFRNHYKVWDVRQRVPALEFSSPIEYMYGKSAVGDSTVYYYCKYKPVFKTFDLRTQKSFDTKHCLNYIEKITWTPDSLVLLNFAQTSYQVYRQSGRICKYLLSMPATTADTDLSARKLVYVANNNRLYFCDFSL